MALLARTVRCSLLESRNAFALSLCRPITTVSHTLEAGNVPDPLLHSAQHTSKDLQQKLASSHATAAAQHGVPSPADNVVANARKNVVAKGMPPSIREMLPLLHSQPSHYITIHIHGRPYLVTKGDTVRLPFLMPNVKPGDVLRLNRATHIGSRDFTLMAPEAVKGTADHGKKVFYLDERMFVCRGRVTAVESEPMRVEEKTKRRQRHVKHVRSKLRSTILTISDLEVKSLEDYEKVLRKD